MVVRGGGGLALTCVIIFQGERWSPFAGFRGTAFSYWAMSIGISLNVAMLNVVADLRSALGGMVGVRVLAQTLFRTHSRWRALSHTHTHTHIHSVQYSYARILGDI